MIVIGRKKQPQIFVQSRTFFTVTSTAGFCKIRRDSEIRMRRKIQTEKERRRKEIGIKRLRSRSDDEKVFLTFNATVSEASSEKGVEPLNQVMEAAGRAPEERHMRVTTVPSSMESSIPITSVVSGRTGKQGTV